MTNPSVAIISGGASGLGLSMAHLLHEENTKVVIFDISDKGLSELPEHFVKQKVDVTDPQQVQNAIDTVVDSLGKIDILINNAGVIYNEPLVNITKKSDRQHNYDAYKKVIDVNLNSVFLMTSAVAEKMIMNRTRGVVINISSICAKGNPGQTAYSAAKAGVNAFTSTWAQELGAFGIRVVAVAPGFINTESTHDALEKTTVDTLIKKTPLRKLGDAADISQAVLSIINNPYINGTVIEVNGGLRL